MGLSHVPLANVALDALEDWSSHIPLETMQPCYTTVLPLLDGYLKNTSTSCECSGVRRHVPFPLQAHSHLQ